MPEMQEQFPARAPLKLSRKTKRYSFGAYAGNAGAISGTSAPLALSQKTKPYGFGRRLWR